MTHSQSTRPLRNTKRLAIECDAPCLDGVLQLLSWQGPLAIAGLVVAIVVNALNGMTGSRAVAHIRNEVRKLHPSLANLDASSTISRVMRIARTQTTLFHVTPSIVFGCFKKSVLSALRGGHLLSITTAANSAPTPQTLSVDYDLASAVAPAKPVGRFVSETDLFYGSFDYQEAPEFVPDHIF